MITALGIFLVGYLPGLQDLYRMQTFLGVALLVCLVAWTLKKKFSPLPALLFFWVSLSGVYCAFYPTSPYAQYGNFIATAFAGNAAQSLVVILGLTAFALIRIPTAHVVWGLLALSLLDAYRIFTHQIGVLNNPAMDATFLAVMLPMLTPPHFKNKWKRFWPYAVLVPAIIASGSSTALAVLAVGIAAPFLLKLEIRRVLQIGVIVLIAGFYVSNDGLFNDNGRFHIWKAALDFMTANFNWATGAGTGSFTLFGPHIQELEAQHGVVTGVFVVKDNFIWLHNDWLQVFFEQGAIGLVIALGVFALALWKSRRRNLWLFSSLSAYGFSMLTQMPWRYLPSALLGVFLLKLALAREAFGDEKISGGTVLNGGNLVAGGNPDQHRHSKR